MYETLQQTRNVHSRKSVNQYNLRKDLTWILQLELQLQLDLRKASRFQLGSKGKSVMTTQIPIGLRWNSTKILLFAQGSYTLAANEGFRIYKFCAICWGKVGFSEGNAKTQYESWWRWIREEKTSSRSQCPLMVMVTCIYLNNIFAFLFSFRPS